MLCVAGVLIAEIIGGTSNPVLTRRGKLPLHLHVKVQNIVERTIRIVKTGKYFFSIFKKPKNLINNNFIRFAIDKKKRAKARIKIYLILIFLC